MTFQDLHNPVIVGKPVISPGDKVIILEKTSFEGKEAVVEQWFFGDYYGVKVRKNCTVMVHSSNVKVVETATEAERSISVA